MILKKDLLDIINDQKNYNLKFDLGINRSDLNVLNIKSSFALIISGIRRCGKSTFLHQIKSKHNNYAFFNFEDTRLGNFELVDFNKLDNLLVDVYKKIEIYFFDEIQNIPKWEIYIRQLLDKNKKVVITGSNASMLSKELGTRLTGRYLKMEMFPFSYLEFLKFYNKKASLESFKLYFKKGGFPDFLKINDENILQQLLLNIIERDIVVRYNLRNSKTIKDLAIYLISNIGKEYSYNNLKKLFNLGSINTIISFISYLEESYLLFSINRFDYSIKKQNIYPKKIYCIDNGLARANSLSFSKDYGRLLENLVFIFLKKSFTNIYYYKTDNIECDFIIKEKNKITKAVQVCYDLNSDNKNREINGLVSALNKFKLKEGIILTYNQKDKLKIDNKLIKIVPVWKWILE
jgi:predicted AAA+ superfamily ATPase